MIAESTLHSKVVHNKEIKGDGKVGRKKKMKVTQHQDLHSNSIPLTIMDTTDCTMQMN